MELPLLWVVLALVALSRVAELIHARRNTERLLAQGGIEHGRGHYPFIVAVHAGWITSMAVLIPPGAEPIWPWLAVFIGLQAARVWVIASLGPYWTTRVITLPYAPLIRRGPYRFMRHPNYVVVAGEIASLPLAFDAWEIALIFSVLNALILAHRIRVEQTALAPRTVLPEPTE